MEDGGDSMWNWWRDSRRKKLLKSALDPALQAAGEKGAWQWSHAPVGIRSQAIQWCRIFIAEKNWEGCNGLHLTDEMKWTVASQAAMMVVKYSDWHFDNVSSILIYPDTYVVPQTTQNIGEGLQIVSDSMRQGEAWYHGPVVLNWNDIQRSKNHENYGNHIVVHELSHQMDMLNSRNADGVPPLPAQTDSEKWRKSFQSEYEMARNYVASGHNILINDYGLTSLGEFFAVSSELYFQLPHELGEYHPGVFELLLEFYQCDWREWIPR